MLTFYARCTQVSTKKVDQQLPMGYAGFMLHAVPNRDYDYCDPDITDEDRWQDLRADLPRVANQLVYLACDQARKIIILDGSLEYITGETGCLDVADLRRVRAMLRGGYRVITPGTDPWPEWAPADERDVYEDQIAVE